MGLSDKNFAIDTTGEYCQCNLIDSSSTVKNPSGKRPKECETCEFKDLIECHICGSETLPEEFTFIIVISAWVRMYFYERIC